MNSVQVIGNLTKDPQVRATKTGKTVASFSVAVNRKYVSPQGEEKEATDFVNVTAWGQLAAAVGNKLKKGSKVFVEGRFTTRTYETQAGEKRYISEVNANFIALPIIQGRASAEFQPGDAAVFNRFGNPTKESQNYDQGSFGEDAPF